MNMNKFLLAYIEMALWISKDNDNKPMDERYSIHKLHPDTLAKMKADCVKFQADNAEFITYDTCLTATCPEKQAGLDFWLTRNGHGAGFWEDTVWEREAGEKLTAASKEFGECHLYIGDDGLIHLK
jgi:hypothetical protein